MLDFGRHVNIKDICVNTLILAEIEGSKKGRSKEPIWAERKKEGSNKEGTRQVGKQPSYSAKNPIKERGTPKSIRIMQSGLHVDYAIQNGC